MEHDALVAKLHEKGINVRHLGMKPSLTYFVGLLRHQLEESGTNPTMIKFLLNVMISRTFKNFWRSEIKLKERDKSVEIICK